MSNKREIFLKVRQEFVDTNQPSTFGQVRAIPERFEQLIRKPPMKKVSNIKEFFKNCLTLIHDKDVVTELTSLIEEMTKDLRPEKRVNHIGRKVKVGQELKMTMQIRDYDMDYIILDLGSYVNILTRQTWESMNKSRLDWSPIQLRLVNQSKVLPIGRFS